MPLTLANLAVAAAVGVLGGFVRGISGFGAALVMVPTLALVVAPAQAVIIVQLVSAATNLPLVGRARRQADWPSVWRLLVAAVLAIPLGLAVLTTLAPVLLTRLAGVVVLATCVLLWYQRRLHWPAGTATASVAGVASGLLGGAVALPGPPVVLYFLATGQPAAVSRASFIVYFALLLAVNLTALALLGLIDGAALLWAALMTPAMLAGGHLGEIAFRRGGERHFRAIALAILATTGAAALLRA